MTNIRSHFCTFFLALIFCVASPARAAQPLYGKNLIVSAPCLSALHITTSATLRSDAEPEHPVPAGVTITTDPKTSSIVIIQKECAAQPLTIKTRPELPLTLDNTGKTPVTLDDRSSTVFIKAGSAPLEMGRAGELGLIATGGPVTIRTLSASARIREEASATLTINEVAAPALALYLGDQSSFLAKAGHLQALEVTSASTKNAVFHITTEIGIFRTVSEGDIVVDRVSGTLATERGSSGRIMPNAAAPRGKQRADTANALPQ